MTSPDARPLAKRLLAAGIPVVVVHFGERYPDDWSHLTAAECDLSSYRPGKDALALDGGHGIDLVDEDTKDGVDKLPPFKHFGLTRTPSGGRHFVVPSNGLGQISPLTTEAGRVGDYVGGRADGTGRRLGFLPGSVRSKPTHEGRAYVEEEPWDVEACLAAKPDVDLMLVLTECGGSAKARERYVDDSPPRDPALGLHPYAKAAIEAEIQRLMDLPYPWVKHGSYWDPTTFEVACNLIEFANSNWSGYTLEQAEADLFANAPTDEAWGERQHQTKWDNALARVEDGGRREPETQQRLTAEEEFGPVEAEVVRPRFLFRPGGSFILDTSPDAVPVWGSGSEVLMSEGEALIIAAAQGLGKTTLAQQFALARCGLRGDLLGYPVEPGRRRVLYLAMDRPKQAARSFQRMVTEDQRAPLNECLWVWEGPPFKDMAENTDLLAEMCAEAGADTVVVDSLKDAALNLSEDGPGSGWNRARQTALKAGVEVLELHHNRKKPQGKTSQGPQIDDIYGSTWITSGAGSVIFLTGDPGDPIVGLHHVKQPADPVGPLQIVHDHVAGESTVYHAADLVGLAARAGGITAVQAASALFEKDSPTANEKKKAERRLASLVAKGLLVVVQEGDRATRTPTKWGRATTDFAS